MAEPKVPIFTLDRSTLIPLGLLITVVLSAISGTVWLQASFMDLKYQLKDNTDTINEIKMEIQEKMTDRWTRTDMTNFLDLLKAKNPELKIPDIK